MINVVYHCCIACPFTLSAIQRALRIAAQQEKKIKGTIEITIVGDKKMRQLNRQYRGKDKVTDVLSFAWQDDQKIKSTTLAQIYICYPQIVRQAKDFGVDSKEEFIRMLTHGLLHSVGYDHVAKSAANKMFALQEEIVGLVQQSRQ